MATRRPAHDARIQRAIDRIRTNFADALTVDDLARAANMSRGGDQGRGRAGARAEIAEPEIARVRLVPNERRRGGQRSPRRPRRSAQSCAWHGWTILC
jgi:hypothetical protein